jgi:hypothetical protein
MQQKRQSVRRAENGTQYLTGTKQDLAKAVLPTGKTLDVSFVIPGKSGTPADYLAGLLWWEIYLELPNGQSRRFMIEPPNRN